MKKGETESFWFVYNTSSVKLKKLLEKQISIEIKVNEEKQYIIKNIMKACNCSESIAIEYVNQKIETQKNKLKQNIDK